MLKDTSTVFELHIFNDDSDWLDLQAAILGSRLKQIIIDCHSLKFSDVLYGVIQDIF